MFGNKGLPGFSTVKYFCDLRMDDLVLYMKSGIFFTHQKESLHPHPVFLFLEYAATSFAGPSSLYDF